MDCGRGGGREVELGRKASSSTTSGRRVVQDKSSIRGSWPMESERNLDIRARNEGAYKKQPRREKGLEQEIKSNSQIIVIHIPPSSTTRLGIKKVILALELVRIDMQTHHATNVDELADGRVDGVGHSRLAVVE